MKNHLNVREVAVPVRAACCGGLYGGVDAQGEACLYAVMGQHSGAGGLFLLRVDPETGACRRYEAPPQTKEGRVSLWSQRRRCLFIYAGASQVEPGLLLRFDPTLDRIEDLGPANTEQCYKPVSMAEAPDGALYLGSFTACALTRYRPETGEFTHYGPMDDMDQYLYVQCGEDGTVACTVKMARPHVVAFDPQTGERRAVGPWADTDSQTGHVEMFKAADGLLYIDSHEGLFRVQGLEAVPVERRPEPAEPARLGDGSTFRFIDNRVIARTIEVVRPDGERRVITLDYEGAGTEIYLVRPGPDGRLYGSSVLPLHFFSCDPASGEAVDHGQCSTASGEVYSMDWLDGKLYFCAYTHGILGVYDPARPYSFGGPVPGRPGEFRQGRPDPSGDLGHRFDEDDNPVQLGRMDTVAYRPRDMLAGPAGKVWVASVPDYGMWGGTLSWYDPRTGEFGGAHRHIYRDCSPYTLTYIPEIDRLVVGFCIYGGSGTEPRAETTGLVMWDPVEDREAWRGDVGLKIIGVMDLEYAGGGLVYAVVHPAPADVLIADLMLLDLPGGKIVSRTRLDDVAGWPLEVSFQRDDRYLYGATRAAVYRVPLGTTDVEVLWHSDSDGPTAAGALLDGRYYFGTMHRLRAVDVRL